MKIYVDGLGLRAPGFADWPTGREILTGRQPYHPTEILLPMSDLLPPAERRRTTETVKLALAVGSEAMSEVDISSDSMASVFASSGSDGVTITAILEILASANREVSPTRFHNSVHNAPSGYWSIATRSQEVSTSICGHDFSFSAGLIEAASQVLTEQKPVLLVVYDLPYPVPLDAARPIIGVFGAAMVLSAQPTARSLAALSMTFARHDAPATTMADPALEMLRTGNPAARALPLLSALAGSVERQIALHHVAGTVLTLQVTPLTGGAS
jgi:hypothetical protein